MIDLLVATLLAALCPLAHELGHWLAAAHFGHRLKFRLAWARLGPVPVPRGIWSMPDDGPTAQRIIAQSGFCAEIFWALLCVWVSRLGFAAGAVALVHFVFYPWYARAESDFRWMIDNK